MPGKFRPKGGGGLETTVTVSSFAAHSGCREIVVPTAISLGISKGTGFFSFSLEHIPVINRSSTRACLCTHYTTYPLEKLYKKTRTLTLGMEHGATWPYFSKYGKKSSVSKDSRTSAWCSGLGRNERALHSSEKRKFDKTNSRRFNSHFTLG